MAVGRVGVHAVQHNVADEGGGGGAAHDPDRIAVRLARPQVMDRKREPVEVQRLAIPRDPGRECASDRPFVSEHWLPLTLLRRTALSNNPVYTGGRDDRNAVRADQVGTGPRPTSAPPSHQGGPCRRPTRGSGSRVRGLAPALASLAFVAHVLHFDKAGLPPVNAFWSVTAYDTEGYFIPNALKRQALGDRDKLAFNPDRSLDLYIQADSPGGDKEANWLPVAKAPFTLLMRLYSPKAEILDGTWTPPLVKRVN